MPPPEVKPVRLLPRPLYLAGREALLSELEHRLVSRQVAGTPRTVVLCGLGGVGKTSVALTFAHRRVADHTLVWQLPAEDESTMRAAFGQLARQLGRYSPADKTADPVVAVHAALAGRPGPWVLLLDNAPDLASVRHALPPVGDGRVLITSRSRHWPREERVEVPVLNERDAADFLMLRTGETSPVSASLLASELGCLPLALEQAAAYIEATGEPLDQYLAAFIAQRTRLLNRGRPLDYDACVASTWSISFKDLQRRSPVAVDLLRLLSCFASEPVPLPLLLRPRDSGDRPGRRSSEEPVNGVPLAVAERLAALMDPFTVNDSLASLGEFSLTSPPRSGTVTVHRLVQAVTQDQLKEDERHGWRRAAEILLGDALPKTPEDPGSWADYSALLPHALTVLPTTSSWSDLTARFLLAKGDCDNARELWERILHKRREELGPDDKSTLGASNNLAVALYSKGDAHGSRAHLEDVVARSSIADRPDVLGAVAMNNLAVTVQGITSFQEARHVHEQALSVRRRILGNEHPDTLTSMGNYALLLHLRGRVSEARKIFTEVLLMRSRTLGTDHPATTLAMSYLGMALRECGRLAAAKEMHERILDIRSRVLGPQHPSTLRTMSNIGVVLRAYGDLRAAEDIHERALEMRRRLLGEDHPDTLRSRSNRACVIAEQGKYSLAAAQFEEVLDINRRVLGRENDDTLNTMGYLGVVHLEQGHLDVAEDLFSQVLSVRLRRCGTIHPDTVRAMTNLADTLLLHGRMNAAIQLYRETTKTGRARLGVFHPETLRAMNNIVIAYHVRGEAKEALKLCEQLVKTCRRVRGAKHPETLRVMNNMAYLSAESGNIGEAKRMFSYVLSAVPQVIGPEHILPRFCRSNAEAVLCGRRPDETKTASGTAPPGRGLLVVYDFEPERPSLRLTLQLVAEGRTVATM